MILLAPTPWPISPPPRYCRPRQTRLRRERDRTSPRHSRGAPASYRMSRCWTRPSTGRAAGAAGKPPFNLVMVLGLAVCIALIGIAQHPRPLGIRMVPVSSACCGPWVSPCDSCGSSSAGSSVIISSLGTLEGLALGTHFRLAHHHRAARSGRHPPGDPRRAAARSRPRWWDPRASWPRSRRAGAPRG